MLGSGSKGNSILIESAGRRLLVDAGFACRQIEQRLETLGESAGDLDAMILTHEHRDHTRGVDVLSRRHDVPFYATEGTLEGMNLTEKTAIRAHRIASGRPFEVAGFAVEPFSIPHDAREPVGFVVEDAAGNRIGVVADLGTRSQLAWGRLRDLDALIIETNHDLQMLRDGPYPWVLKQRVAGRHGHLSNKEAAEGLPELVSDRLEVVILYHLSRTNNEASIASEAIGSSLEAEGCKARVLVTSQDQPTPWIEIGGR
ncbi:MAG: MBL fold metallo-hydrolase [Acidobacteriota bacterium]